MGVAGMERRKMWKSLLANVGANFRQGQSDGEISGVPFSFHEGWCDELPMLIVVGAAATPAAVHLTHYAHVLSLPEMPENWQELETLPYQFDIAGLVMLSCQPLSTRQIQPFQRLVVCNPTKKQSCSVPTLVMYSIDDLPKAFDGSKVLVDLHPESDIFVGRMDELFHGETGPVTERLRSFLRL